MRVTSYRHPTCAPYYIFVCASYIRPRLWRRPQVEAWLSDVRAANPQRVVQTRVPVLQNDHWGERNPQFLRPQHPPTD